MRKGEKLMKSELRKREQLIHSKLRESKSYLYESMGVGAAAHF